MAPVCSLWPVKAKINMTKSWEFYAGDRSLLGRFYEWLRRRLNERLVRFLINELDRSGNDEAMPKKAQFRTLEAGSGTAYATSCFSQQPNVDGAVCLDLDLDALRQARMRDPKLCAVVGDMRRLPFKEGAFDLVFNSSTVEHLERPEEAAAEMRRVCNALGRVFIGVPYLYGPLGFQPIIGRTSVGIWLGRVFSKSSLEALMRRSGLRPISSIRYFLRVFLGVVASPCESSVELSRT